MSEPSQYKIISHTVVAVRFPDNGPEQSKVSNWVEDNGGKMSLYDGAVENGIETSTSVSWRWKYGVVTPSREKYVYVGHYIVKMPTGLFDVYAPDMFAALFSEPSSKEKS